MLNILSFFEEIILLISSIIVKRKELDFNYVIPHNSNLNNSALVYDKGEKQIWYVEVLHNKIKKNVF